MEESYSDRSLHLGSPLVHFDGEYWSARELAKLLGYADWRNFVDVIEKAKEACQNSGQEISDHFGDVTTMVAKFV
jgi:DNA-damage-inducible protein D